MQRLRSRLARPGLGVCLKQSISNSVTDPYLADTRHPAPAARCDHHDAAAEAASPVTVAVAVIAHSTTAFAATASGSGSRNERGGADGSDGSDGKIDLRIIILSLVLLDVISHPACLSGEGSVGSTAR